MADEITSNRYEEARKQRLLENNKKFEELGILKIAKTLSDLSKPEKKIFPEKCEAMLRRNAQIESRRSTRTRYPIFTNHDDVRPLEEVKIATHAERLHALESALKRQSEMQSENPSVVMSMSRTHVCTTFQLFLEREFCKKHLQECRMDMVLEDEDGNQYKVVTGMHGRLGIGWRAFVLEHKLDFGDALLFELVEPQRFKVYIFKASDGNVKEEISETEYGSRKTTASENTKKVDGDLKF